MEKITKRFYPDVILHLGDSINDATILQKKFPLIPFECIKGNVDEGSNAPDEHLVSLENVNIYLTHCQKEQNMMIDKAMEENAQMYLYGNTHMPTFSVTRGIVLMNPGAIGSHFDECSFGLIDVFESEFTCSVLFANHYELL